MHDPESHLTSLVRRLIVMRTLATLTGIGWCWTVDNDQLLYQCDEGKLMSFLPDEPPTRV